MKTIVQEHPMGCGLACVASVAGVSYSDVLKIVQKELATSRGYYCRELVDALGKFSLEYDYKKVTEKTKRYLRKDGVIVFVARSKKYPEGHYLVRTKKGWMNPWINYPIISPTRAGFNQKLPGKAQWIIIPKEYVNP